MESTSSSTKSEFDSIAVQEGTRDYLQHFDVYARLNEIVTRVLDDRPQDPHSYIAEELSRWSEGLRQTRDPVPSPPADAFPSEQRPQPRLSNVVAVGGEQGQPEQKRTPPTSLSDLNAFSTPIGAAQSTVQHTPDTAAATAFACADTSPAGKVDPTAKMFTAEPMEQAPQGPLGAPEVDPPTSSLLKSDQSNTLPIATACDPGDGSVFQIFVDEASESDSSDDAAASDDNGAQETEHFFKAHKVVQGTAAYVFFQDVLRSSLVRSLSSQSASTSSLFASELGGDCSIDLLHTTCLLPWFKEAVPKPTSDDVPGISLRDVCFAAVFDVITGHREQHESTPSTLYALDFGVNLNVARLLVTVTAFAEAEWDRLLAHGLCTLVGLGGRMIENCMLRKLKFMLMARLTEVLGSINADQATELETVVREVIGTAADRLLQLNLALSEGPARTPLLHPDLNVSHTAAFVCSHLVHRFSHVPIGEVTKLVALAQELGQAESAFAALVDELLLSGLCDSHNVGALATLAWRAAAHPPLVAARSELDGVAFDGEEAVDVLDLARFVVSLTCRVKSAIEDRYLDAVESNVMTFSMKCPSAADALQEVDRSALARVFPHASLDAVDNAVSMVIQLADGQTTLSRTFFSLACLGVFATQLSRFVSALLRTLPNKSLSVCLWLCAVAQNLRGGMRSVFSVKQLIDDDGLVDQQQALLDLKLTTAIALPPSSAGGGWGGKPVASTNAAASSDMSFHDLVSHVRRDLYTREDQRELLTYHSWDYDALGRQYENSAFWLSAVETRLHRIGNVYLYIDELLQLASNNLRRAASIERSMLSSQKLSSQYGKHRLPLALRAQLCTCDTLVSMLLSCFVVGVPSDQQTAIVTDWSLLSNKEQTALVTSALEEASASAFVTRKEIDEVAPLITAAFSDIIVGTSCQISRQVLDAYMCALACAAIWNEHIHVWHKALFDALVNRDVFSKPQWRLFLHNLSVTCMSREENLLKFSPTDAVSLHSLQSWSASMMRFEDVLKAAVTAKSQVMADRGSLRQASHIRKQFSKLHQCFALLYDLATAPDRCQHELGALAVQNALEGMTHVHHYALASLVYFHVWKQQSSHDISVVVYLGRVVAQLTSLCLPRVAELDKVLRVMVRSGVLSSTAPGAVSGNSSQNGAAAAPGPQRSQSVIQRRPSLQSGTTSPLQTMELSANVVGTVSNVGPVPYIGHATWQSVFPSALAFEVFARTPDHDQHMRGWYAAFAAEALRRVAGALHFDDIGRLSSSEFQLSLQHACHRLMAGGMTLQQFQQFAAALKERFGSSARTSMATSQNIFTLLEHAGENEFQFPSDEDRTLVSHALPQELKVADATATVYRNVVLRAVTSIPVLLLAPFFDLSDGGDTHTSNTYHALLHELCRLSFSSLCVLVRGCANLESVASYSDVARFLRIVALLTCGGMPHGFALLSCFGDVIAETVIGGFDFTMLGRWARVMLKVSTFVENKVHYMMSKPSPTMVTVPSTFEEFIDVNLLKTCATRVETMLLPSVCAPVLFAKQQSLADVVADTAREIFGCFQTTESLRSFSNVGDRASSVAATVEGRSTDLLISGVFFMNALSIGKRRTGSFSLTSSLTQSMVSSTSSRELTERLVLATVNELILALDDRDRQIMGDFHSKRKECLQALQQVDPVPVLERQLPLTADSTMHKPLSALLSEACKTLAFFASSWHVAREPASSSATIGEQEPAVPYDAEEEESSDVIRILPPFYYRPGLCPPQFIELLVSAGIVPKDTTDMCTWVADAGLSTLQPTLTTASAPQVAGQLKRQRSMAARPLESAVSMVFASVPAAASVVSTVAAAAAAAMLRLLLRYVHSTLRDLLLQAHSVRSADVRGELVRQLQANQSLIYLNLQKNESMTKQQLAAEWQASYVAASVVTNATDDADERSALSIFKVKEQSSQIVEFSVLRGVFLDVYFPLTVSYLRAAVNTCKFLATSSETKKVPQELLLHSYSVFSAQRGEALQRTSLSHDVLQELIRLWGVAFSGAPQRPEVLELLSKFTGMTAANVTVAITMLNRIVPRLEEILSQRSFVATMLFLTMQCSTEEEELILQLFGSQWGPVMHALLIALKEFGQVTDRRHLIGFVSMFRMLRIVARCCSRLKKSQQQEGHFQHMPLRQVQEFVKRQLLPALDPASRTARALADAIAALCDRSDDAALLAGSTNVASVALMPFANGVAAAGGVSLRKWMEERVLSAFTRLQLGSAALHLHERLQALSTTSGAECEIVRWVLVTVYLAVRREDEIQQKLQLPPSPSPSLSAVRCAVSVAATRSYPPIDSSLRERCQQAMIRSVDPRENLRSLVVTLFDYVYDVIERLHDNLVDAYSRYEPLIRHSLSKCPVSFSEFTAICLSFNNTLQLSGVSSTYGAPRRTLFASDKECHFLFATLCRSLYTSHFAALPKPTSAEVSSAAPAAVHDEFPHAELKLFGYSWLAVMPDIVEIYKTAFVKYRKALQERGKKHAVDLEDMRSVVLLLHLVAIEANDDANKPLSAAGVLLLTEEWVKSVKDCSRLSHLVFSSATKALLDTVEQCEFSNASKDLFASPALKSCWNKVLWYCSNVALSVLVSKTTSGVLPSTPSHSPALRPVASPLIKAARSSPFDEVSDQKTIAGASAVEPAGRNVAPELTPLPVPTRTAITPSPTSGPSAVLPSAEGLSALVPLRPILPSAAHSQPTVSPAASLPTVSFSVPSRPPAQPFAVVAVAEAAPPSAASRTFTLDEVRRHNTRKDCWVAIHGKVYDVSSFALTHPGGMGVILSAAGKESTQNFDENHEPGSAAFTKVEAFYIGDLAS